MKRRDFVKTGICLGCAGALGAGAMLCKNKGILSDIKTYTQENRFSYKSVKDLPTKIRLDICNLCQLNCAACWLRRDEELIKKQAGGFGYVPFKTFKKFLDTHSFIKEIELSHDGEIFLNPELEKIIKYAYLRKVDLYADNGVNLNSVSEQMAEDLVRYQFKAICVSIDAATPKTYSIYRRGGDFNTVINNIKTINKYKKLYNSPFPYLTYKFILFGHNEHEIDAAKELAKELNMNILFEVNCIPEYSPVKNAEEVMKKTGLKSVSSNIENSTENYLDKENDFYFCRYVFDSPQINWNGDLLGCCANYLHPFKANIFRDGLLKALNDENYIYTKRMLYDFTIQPKEGIICSDCEIYDYLKQNNIEIGKIFMKG